MSQSGDRRPGSLDPMRDLLGARFRDVRPIAKGAIGTVYRGIEESGRAVAIKTLRQATTSPEGLERFRREGELTARLDHPGIVRVHHAGELDGQPYLAYELIPEGRTVRSALEEGCARDEGLRWVLEAADALAHAHERGIVHRDVKAENLLLDRDGRLRVADFGLALACDLDRLTQSGGIVGTPYAMSPEQATGDKRAIGRHSDVWGLGVLLYEVLTGEQPFGGENMVELMAQICEATPRRPSELASVSEALESVCLRALRQDPARRFPHARAFRAALQAAMQETSGAERPASAHLWLLRGGLALAVVLSLVALLWSPAPRGTADPATDPAAHPGEAADAGIAGPTEPEAEEPAEPSWYLALPEAERPRLPAGVAVAAAVGEYLNEADGSVLVWVPPGKVIMGPAIDRDFGRNLTRFTSGPRDPVEVSQGVFIGKYEVTVAQWAAYLEAMRLPPRPAGEGPKMPVSSVTWKEAMSYAKWAGARLPREIEWERAARGDDGRLFPWGGADLIRKLGAGPGMLAVPAELHGLACLGGKTGGRTTYTAEVGSYPDGVSPFGCHDMAGNVWEWTLDALGTYPPRRLRDPGGPVREGGTHVARGGAWNCSAIQCLTSSRLVFLPSQGNLNLLGNVGFRVARDP